MIYHLILGSNMDEPELQINKAVDLIAAEEDITLLRKSSMAITKAYGYEKQDDFCNQVLEVESQLAPDALLLRLQSIEEQRGRIRGFKWGPRRIDIDILLAGDLVIKVKHLEIPHYDFHNREFALKLLCELIPEQMHPVYHKTMSELLEALGSPGGNK